MLNFPHFLPASVLAVLLLPAGFTAAADAPKEDPNAPVSYYRKIRPIFEANCQGCHQPAKAKGGFVMTEFAAMVKGGDDDGPGLVPGKPEASSVVKNIIPDEKGEVQMPKKADVLKAEEVAVIRRWIAEGAVDDTPANARVVYTTEHPPVYTTAPLVTALDYAPDGSVLAVSGFHEVLLVNPATGALAARLVGLSERIESVRFSPDGKRLAVTGGLPGRAGEVQVWDVAERKLLVSKSVTADTVYGGSWSPDGTMIAFGGADKSARVIEAATGKQVFFVLTHDDWVQDTVFSVKGDYVVSVGRDMTAKLLEVASQRFVDNITSITPGALKGGLQAVARHPQRDEILVGGSTGEPLIYRMNRQVDRKIGDDSNLVRKYPAIDGRLWSVSYAPDGKTFAAGGSLDGKGMVATYNCDVDTKLPDDIKGIMNKVSTERNAEEVGKVNAWLTAGAVQLKLVPLPCGIYAVEFKPDGTELAAAGADGKIRIINAAEGTVARELQPFPLAPAAAQPVVK